MIAAQRWFRSVCVVAVAVGWWGCGGAVADVVEGEEGSLQPGEFGLLGGVSPAPVGRPLPVDSEDALANYEVPAQVLAELEQVTDATPGEENPFLEASSGDETSESEEGMEGAEDDAILYDDAEDDAEVAGDDEPSDSDEDFDDELATAANTLVGGRLAYGRKAVGQLYLRTESGWELCTATLIRSRVIITAAHCFLWSSSSSTQDYGYFIPQYLLEGERQMRNGTPMVVTNFRSFSRYEDDLARDIALARLHRKVASTVAKPIKLEMRKVKPTRKLETWGYGCTNRKTENGKGTKRAIYWKGPKSTTGRLCAGDSGGPTIAPDSGYGVFQINSAFRLDNGRDLYAKVYPIRKALQKQAYKWR